MQPYSSSKTADLAANRVCPQHGMARPSRDPKDRPSWQQTADELTIAQPERNEAFWRSQPSSNAEMPGSTFPQDNGCYEAEAVQTTAKGLPRPSSWQRKKAAKLRQAKQDTQQGKSSHARQMLSCAWPTTVCVTPSCVHDLQQHMLWCLVTTSTAQAKACPKQMPQHVCCHCSGQSKSSSSATGAAEQCLRSQQQLATSLSEAEELTKLRVRDATPREMASSSTDEPMTQADLSAVDSASQHQTQEANLLHWAPLTQPLGQGKAGRLGNAQPADTQHGRAQVLQLRQDMCDLPTNSKHEDDTGFSSSSDDCAMADAIQPVSQVLPESAMELWDFGGDDQPGSDKAAGGVGADSEAAEALQELEDFCRSELFM